MGFSSMLFLLLFLPVTLAGYYIVNDRIKNIFLLIVSLVFYMCGGVSSILILLGSILFNYVCALILDNLCKGKASRRLMLIVALAGNIGLLCTYKYLPYTLSLVNRIGGLDLAAPNWALPLGISFFTFSSLSYVLDIFFGSSKADKNILNVALYITFFPKMVSGPIVKWNDFQSQLRDRRFVFDNFYDGVKRFIVGLGKKALIADILGTVVEKAFDRGDLSSLSAVNAWLGILCYLVQLYFDFSGYSDMAVGLGKMFGFRLDENFNYPYVSKSVVEYWARWHITLGTWVKHYLYTPVFRALSKRKNKKTGKKLSPKICDYIALLVSWIIIGSWHGAGVKFFVYGLYYFAFILGERIFDNYKKKRAKAGDPVRMNFFVKNVLPHIYLIFVVIFGQVLFRSNNFMSSFSYYGAMFGAGSADASLLMSGNLLILMAAAAVLSTPVIPRLKQAAEKSRAGSMIYLIAESLVLIAILIAAISFSTRSSYNPFIYANF